MISFRPLNNLLKDKGLSKSYLKTKKIIGGATYTVIARAIDAPVKDGVSISAIDALCNAFHCQPGDIMEWVPDDE